MVKPGYQFQDRPEVQGRLLSSVAVITGLEDLTQSHQTPDSIKHHQVVLDPR